MRACFSQSFEHLCEMVQVLLLGFAEYDYCHPGTPLQNPACDRTMLINFLEESRGLSQTERNTIELIFAKVRQYKSCLGLGTVR